MRPGLPAGRSYAADRALQHPLLLRGGAIFDGLAYRCRTRVGTPGDLSFEAVADGGSDDLGEGPLDGTLALDTLEVQFAAGAD